MALITDIDKGAAPLGGEVLSPLETDIFIIRTGYYDRIKREGLQWHRVETGRARRIGRGFDIAGSHQQDAPDGSYIPMGPVSDGTTGQAMCNQDDFFGWEGCDDLIDRMDPVVFVGCIPIPLVDTGKAIQLFPPALPVEGAGIVEAGKDKAKSR